MRQRRASPAISELRSLGPKSQAMLAKIGITTLAQLQKIGAVPAYVMAKRANQGVSLNLLYGLVAALEETDWRIVKRERKLALLDEIERYEHA